MPSFTVSRAFTASEQNVNILDGWQYEFVPMGYGRGAAVAVLLRGTTTGLRSTIYAGGQTIKERSPVQGGGTAGVTPSPLNTSPTTFVASPGDRLKIICDEVAAGTPTLDALIEIEPL